MKKTALIFDIGRFRNEDGPGIRTVVFFKGCPLNCVWCSNPFGLDKKNQLAVNLDKCTGCNQCVAACPYNIAVHNKEADFSKCTACGLCVPVCLPQARTIVGKDYTAQHLFQEVSKDMLFYRKNGGGVTLSGGEVLTQHEVAAELLRLCKKNYINTCMETSAFAPWEHLIAVAKHCDLVFVDIKCMDEKRHLQYAGVSNSIILKNIEKLCQFASSHNVKVIIRRLVVPNYTDDDEDVIATAAFVAKLPGQPELNLLPFHDMGEKKYDMLGKPYTMTKEKMLSPTDSLLTRIQELCKARNPSLNVSIGGGDISVR